MTGDSDSWAVADGTADQQAKHSTVIVRVERQRVLMLCLLQGLMTNFCSFALRR